MNSSIAFLAGLALGGAYGALLTLVLVWIGISRNNDDNDE